LTYAVATVNIGTLPRGERKASWSKVMHSPPAWDLDNLDTDSVCHVYVTTHHGYFMGQCRIAPLGPLGSGHCRSEWSEFHWCLEDARPRGFSELQSAHRHLVAQFREIS